METEYVLRIPLDRHVINTRRPFAAVVDDIRSRTRQQGPSEHRPVKTVAEADIRHLRRMDGAPAGVRLVSIGEFDVASPPRGERDADRVMRLLVDVPAATGELVRFLPDAGASCPVTILVHQIAAGGARLVYDSVESAVSVYKDDDSLALARLVDLEVLGLLRQVAGED